MNLIYLALLCGLIATSFVHRSEARLHAESIVGGFAAAVGEHTYAVSIQANDQHVCGGCILNNRFIITAAHCFMDLVHNRFKDTEYIVVAGVTNAHIKEEQHRVEREVAKIYIPREYHFKFADIAILQLKLGLDLNRFITNVVLPPNAKPHPTYENQHAAVSGYGHNWVNMHHDPQNKRHMEVLSGSESYERKYAQVNILPNTACQSFYRDIQDSQLCGGLRQRSPAKPEGLCTGDSGSPLVIGNTIIGVVCTSPTGCREDLVPAVYTRVTSFIPFIRNAINGIRTADMRVAKYKVIACGPGCHNKVLEED